MMDYLKTKKEARTILREVGIPYATETTISFFFVREPFLGKTFYVERFGDEKRREVVEKSGIRQIISKFEKEKNKQRKEFLRQKGYSEIDKAIKEIIPNLKTP